MPNPPRAFFDSHLHIIDPRFTLVANQGYIPPAFTVRDYLTATAPHTVAGGCVVSGSFQLYDQHYLVAALAELGAGFVGVTQLPPDCPDQQIIELSEAGVRGIRFNLVRGSTDQLQQLEYFACRVYELAGWHAELYVDASQLQSLLPVLCRLPLLAIDHLGLTESGLPHLLRLVETGTRVKACGFGRLDFDPRKAIATINTIAPQALMFGTDLPSTRAPKPYSHADLDLLLDCVDAQSADNILLANARHFYLRETYPHKTDSPTGF